MKKSKAFPDFSFEKLLWRKNLRFVAGVDEVGRGSLAGPVVTAVVGFSQDQTIGCYIHDSKKLSSKQRETANKWIIKNSLFWGIGSATAAEIDKLGIVIATNRAFRRAVKNSNSQIDHLLIDAFYIPRVKHLPKTKQTPIIKGDALSVSIAAASIIAKVHRDKLMTELSKVSEYKKYNWDKNKGYGTKSHKESIKQYGKSRLHRVSFLLKFS